MTVALWPESTAFLPNGGLSVGGVPLEDIADRFGTPTYVFDEGEVRRRCRAYKSAFPENEVVYAAEAFFCREVTAWIRDEGLGFSCGSAEELMVAMAAGVPAERMVVDGHALSPDDLQAAVRAGVGRIVVDSGSDIRQLCPLLPADRKQSVLLRVRAGVATGTDLDAGADPGEPDRGPSVLDGSAEYTIGRILKQPKLELTGLHCHLGSQITGSRPYVLALRRLVGLIGRVRRRFGIVLPEIDLGGGHSVASRMGDLTLDIADLSKRLRAESDHASVAARLPRPRLIIEPGRGIVGTAGIALHRVLTVERTNTTEVVVVDGRVPGGRRRESDGVQFFPRLVGQRARVKALTVTATGQHRELTSHTLTGGVDLPADLRPGDLIGVPAVGAYSLPITASCDRVDSVSVVGVEGGQIQVLAMGNTPDICGRSVRP